MSIGFAEGEPGGLPPSPPRGDPATGGTTAPPSPVPVFSTVPGRLFRKNELRLARFVGERILPVEISTESRAIDGGQGERNYHVRFVRPRFRQYDNLPRWFRLGPRVRRSLAARVAYRNLNLRIRIEIAQDAQMDKARVEQTVTIRHANEGGWIPCDLLGSHIRGTLLLTASSIFLTKDLEGIDVMVNPGEDSP